MSSRNDGGPAFPRPASEDTSSGTLRDGNCVEDAQAGMSLRDWFAGQALAAWLSTQAAQSQLEIAIREAHAEAPEDDRRAIARRILARRAYLQADAMLAARRGAEASA